MLPVQAQIQSELACRELALQAIASTDQLCDGTAPGEICFGSGHVQASLLESAQFTLPGDRASTASLQQIMLSSLALDDQVWSFAVVELPGTLDARMVAWGDVLIENRSADGRDSPVASPAGMSSSVLMWCRWFRAGGERC